MPHTSDVTGIVLAGGRSSRFGRDKLTEPYEGRPLLHHAIVALDEVCGEILISIAPGVEPPEPPAEVVAPVRVVPDPEPHAGPLAGLASALAEADTPLAIVVGGDMPGLSPAVLLELVLTAGEEGAGAAALAQGDDVRPLPCAVRTSCLVVAQGLLAEGERSLRGLLSALDTRTISEEHWRALDPEARSLRDVDLPEDLEA